MRNGKWLIAVFILVLFPVLFVVYNIFGKKDKLPEPAPQPEANTEPVEVPTAGIKVAPGDPVAVTSPTGTLVQEVKQVELVAASETFPSIEGELLIKPSKQSLYGFEK